MLKTHLNATLTILSISLAAHANPSEKPTDRPEEIVKQDPISAGYNASASYPCINNWDIFITADYLYWDWSQSSFLLGTTTPIENVALQGSTGSRKTVYQTPGYASGFQVGVGVNMPKMDDWNLFSEYTRYRNSNTTSILSGPGSMIIFPTSANPSSDSSLSTLEGTFSSNIQMNYDSVDFLLKRPFYFGKKLTANFGAGLRALFISQKFIREMDGFNGADLITIINRTETSTPSTWGLGPKFSFETNWMLGHGLQIMMNLATSVLYTRYTLNSNGTAEIISGNRTFNTSFSWDEISQLNALRPITESFVGLGWKSAFCNKKYYIALSAGYNFDVFWNYDMLNYAASQTQGDMFLQGLNVQTRFDF